MDRSPEPEVPAMVSVASLVPTSTRDARCDKHGAYVGRSIGRGRHWTHCPACVAASREQEERKQRQQVADALEASRHTSAIEAARIPARFVGRTFDTFVADDAPQRHALTVCRDFAEAFPEHLRRGTGLVLSGMPGTGKSHLAAAVLQAMLSRDVRYMTCLDLIRAVRDTWRRDSDRSETQMLGYLERLDLLVIDEVGVQYGTDGEQTILFDVLDRRYREVRPTILLTNQDRQGMRKFVGERAFDRLSQTCRWVPFDWASYRPIARKEAR